MNLKQIAITTAGVSIVQPVSKILAALVKPSFRREMGVLAAQQNRLFSWEKLELKVRIQSTPCFDELLILFEMKHDTLYQVTVNRLDDYRSVDLSERYPWKMANTENKAGIKPLNDVLPAIKTAGDLNDTLLGQILNMENALNVSLFPAKLPITHSGFIGFSNGRPAVFRLPTTTHIFMNQHNFQLAFEETDFAFRSILTKDFSPIMWFQTRHGFHPHRDQLSVEDIKIMHYWAVQGQPVAGLIICPDQQVEYTFIPKQAFLQNPNRALKHLQSIGRTGGPLQWAQEQHYFFQRRVHILEPE